MDGSRHKTTSANAGARESHKNAGNKEEDVKTGCMILSGLSIVLSIVGILILSFFVSHPVIPF